MLQKDEEFKTNKESINNSMPPLEDTDVEELAVQGELLVARRALSTHAKEEEMHQKNIFTTRCNVQSKVCSMIIDKGSCTNVASATC